MTDEDIQKLARAIVLEVATLIAKPAPTAPPKQSAPAVVVRWMSVSMYAKRVSYSRTTVQKWIKVGLPTVPGARGSRVEVAAADEWIKAGGVRRVKELSRCDA